MVSTQRPMDGALVSWSNGGGLNESYSTLHSLSQSSCDNYQCLDEEEVGRTWPVALNYPLSIIANLKSKQQRRKKRRSSSEVPGCGVNQSSTKPQLNFDDLPVCVRWRLFSYLDSHTLCQCAMVSSSWFNLAHDDLLWKYLLKRDMATWNVVDHQTHPSIFTEAASDLPLKDIYLRCHPQASKVFGACNAVSPGLRFPFRLPNWFRRPTRIAMFGPGLDTLSVVRTLLFDEDAPFKPNGMTAGHEGVGSGVCIRHNDIAINLMILYKATKAERTRSSDVEEINRLVNVGGVAAAAGAGAGGNAAGLARSNSDQAGIPIAELTRRVKDMCRSVDAFVCVVDNRHCVKDSAVSLVHAMMAAGSGPMRERSVPLLVLSTVESSSQKQKSSVQLADSLKLTLLSQPWRLQDLCLDDIDTFVPGLNWLLEQNS